jgi:mannose-6-phosphate isomerase-like protein (cupin superfamily)
LSICNPRSIPSPSTGNRADSLTLQLRDQDVVLGPNDVFVVPRGVEHCPLAALEASVIMIELKGTVNTGDAGGERTTQVRELGTDV